MRGGGGVVGGSPNSVTIKECLIAIDGFTALDAD